MRLDRSWAVRTFAFPTVVLLGIANLGCPGGKGSSAADNAGGDGGSGNSGANGGNGGNGGSGGAECTPQTEICDRKDNDCDGQVDEEADIPGGCACNVGDAPQPCYTGPRGTEGKGICKAGVQSCENGQWGTCTEEVLPQAEQCNLVDDDCNDVVDDMGTSTCGIGACAAVVDKCINGQLQTCVPGQPSVEVCDGIDNNCNQLTDEGDPMLNADCMTGSLGVCAAGKFACTGSQLVCAPDALPTQETCDGLDNDCDGTTDNQVPGTGGECSTGALGVCAAGTISCKLSSGIYQIDCFSDVEASPEVCDGLDNNCDGATDENNPQGGGACDTGQLGLCQAGTLNCVNGSIQCTPNAQAQSEVCNGVDDNCDGQADEGNPGGGQPCGCGFSGVTQCQNGTLACMGGPTTYFQEDFSDNSAGWTLGPEWQIGPLGTSTTCASCPGSDPTVDHTPNTSDNGVAGLVVGGCTSTALHGFACLESPAINLSNAQGSVYLSFWRHLHSDYPDFVHNKVEAFNGTSWVPLWNQPANSTCINDTAWVNSATQTQFNVTAYKSANFRIRFCFDVTGSGAYSGGGWNVDDVIVASAICP